MTAADVMSRDVVTVSPGTPFAKLVRLLRQKRISALPVVDARRRPLGIVSEADLLVKIEKRHDGKYLFGDRDDDEEAKAVALTAEEAMTSPVVTVAPGVPVADVARRMLGHQIKRLPVVDHQGVLIGIVSRRDLLKVFVRSDADLSSEVHDLLAEIADAFALQDLVVKASDGIITLEGNVAEQSEVDAVAQIVQGIVGVVGVQNRLRPRAEDR